MNLTEQVEQLKQIFEKSQQTLGFAESCTGGLISSSLTEHSGVSQFYKGSVVSYAGDVKESVLGVRLQDMMEFGQVSEPVALQMAQGTRKTLNVDWAASVTGIAGPGGGSEEKPVGMVCFSVVGPGFERAWTHYFDSTWNRKQIQRATADMAYDNLIKAMN